jgi:hypothetical protein
MTNPPTTPAKNQNKKCDPQAAIKMFLEPGFHLTNVKEIMNEADLGYGTFYQY